MPLTPERRAQLDGFVAKMDSDGASSDEIKAVVSDFTTKFGSGASPDPGFLHGAAKIIPSMESIKAFGRSDLDKTARGIPAAMSATSQSEFEKMFAAAREEPTTTGEAITRGVRIVGHGLGGSGLPFLSGVAGPTASLEAGHPREALGDLTTQVAVNALPFMLGKIGKGVGLARGARGASELGESAAIAPELMPKTSMPFMKKETAKAWANAAADHTVQAMSDVSSEGAGAATQAGLDVAEQTHKAAFSREYSAMDQMVGNKLETRNTFVSRPTGILGPDGKELTKLVPHSEKVPVSNVTVDTTPLKEWARDALSRAEAVKHQFGEGTVTALNNVVNAPDSVPLNTMQDYRSALIARTKELDAIAGAEGGTYKHLLNMTDTAMDTAMDSQAPGVKGVYRELNKRYRDFVKTYNESLVAKMAAKDPSQVHRLLLAPGTSVEQIRTVVGELGASPEALDALRANAARDLIFEAKGKIGVKLDGMEHYGKLQEIFTPGQQNSLRQYAAVEAKALAKGVPIHALMAAGMGATAGAKVGLAVGGGPAGAAVGGTIGVLVGTAANRAWGRLILNPKWTIAFTNFAEASMSGGAQAIRAFTNSAEASGGAQAIRATAWASRMQQIARETLTGPMRVAPGMAQGARAVPQSQPQQEEQVQ